MIRLFLFLLIVSSFKLIANGLTFDEIQDNFLPLYHKIFVENLEKEILFNDSNNANYQSILKTYYCIKDYPNIGIIPICKTSKEEICQITRDRRLPYGKLIGYYAYVWDEVTKSVFIYKGDKNSIQLLSAKSYSNNISEARVRYGLIAMAEEYLVLSFKSDPEYFLFYKDKSIIFINHSLISKERYVEYDVYMNEFCE